MHHDITAQKGSGRPGKNDRHLEYLVHPETITVPPRTQAANHRQSERGDDMSARFIALHCGDETCALLANHPTAFLLLTQIAMRAKWKDCSITKLKAGQAFIGDYQAAGIHSEKAYRHAKHILSECGLAAFQGANKGTIATLADCKVFSISADARGGQTGEQGDSLGADKGRARGGQGATNHTDTQSTQTSLALNGASSASPPAISWNAENGFSGITATDRKSWAKAYPALDIERQLAAAHEWLLSNPAKAKKTQWRRFVTGWLARNQERGGDIPSNRPAGRELTSSQLRI